MLPTQISKPSSANYKLTYFPVRARAEPIRYLFAFANVEYEDNRIPKDQWPALKPSTPMGQLPMLEVDGKKLVQSAAIARYLAREFGLAGNSSFEQALADMYVDGVQDLFTSIRPFLVAISQGSGEDVKKEAFGKFKTEGLAPFLDRYEKFLSSNGTGHLVGNKFTWADIVVAEFLGKIVDLWEPNALAKHPKLAGLLKSVNSQPGIAKYIATRPQTPM